MKILCLTGNLLVASGSGNHPVGDATDFAKMLHLLLNAERSENPALAIMLPNNVLAES